MLDGPILASRIHGLEHQQHRPLVLGIELVLQFGQRLDADLQPFLGLALVLRLEPQRVAGIDLVQPEFLPVFKTEGIRQPARNLQNPFFAWHIRTFP